jgi:hypothetical protein
MKTYKKKFIKKCSLWINNFFQNLSKVMTSIKESTIKKYSNHMPPLAFKHQIYLKPLKLSMKWSHGDFRMSHSTQMTTNKHQILNTEKKLDAKYFSVIPQICLHVEWGILFDTLLNIKWLIVLWQLLVELNKT